VISKKLLYFCLFPCFAFGACPNLFHLTFVNGVWNSLNDVEISLMRLVEFSKKHNVFQGHKWEPKYSSYVYNGSEGLKDLIEVYEQKVGESTVDFWKWTAAPGDAPDWFSSTYRNFFLGRFEKMRSIESMNNRLHSHIIKLVDGGGLKLMLVPHSQGNLFVNEAYTGIKSENKLMFNSSELKARVVSVATPANKIESENAYTTLNSDWVIRSIPNSLPSNAANSIPNPGLFDHEFVKHYLLGDTSSVQIASQMKEAVEELLKIDAKTPKAYCDSYPYQKNRTKW